jgi:hypothetical protein
MRLFVKHRRLFGKGPAPEMVLTSSPPAPRAETGGRGLSRRGGELKLIRSGRDWALFSLSGPDASIDPGSVGLAFGRVSASFGEGFCALDIERNNHWKRWCERQGMMSLNNATDASRKVKISMLLCNKGDAPLIIEGDSLSAQVLASCKPVRFERELTLAPGANQVEIHSEGSPMIKRSGSRRPLYWYLADLQIQDLGEVTPGERNVGPAGPAAAGQALRR